MGNMVALIGGALYPSDERIYDGVVGGMAACGVWSVLVSRSGYCSMA
jgi:hypothetical protein